MTTLLWCLFKKSMCKFLINFILFYRRWKEISKSWFNWQIWSKRLWCLWILNLWILELFENFWLGQSFNHVENRHNYYVVKELGPIWGLCNDTGLTVTRLDNNVIKVKIISDKNIKNSIYIPRMSMSPSQLTWPFKLVWRQFSLSFSLF